MRPVEIEWFGGSNWGNAQNVQVQKWRNRWGEQSLCWPYALSGLQRIHLLFFLHHFFAHTFFCFPRDLRPSSAKGKDSTNWSGTLFYVQSPCQILALGQPSIDRVGLVPVGQWVSCSLMLWFYLLGSALGHYSWPLCIYRLLWVGFRASAVGLSLWVGGCGSVARVWSLWFN